MMTPHHHHICLSTLLFSALISTTDIFTNINVKLSFYSNSLSLSELLNRSSLFLERKIYNLFIFKSLDRILVIYEEY